MARQLPTLGAEPHERADAARNRARILEAAERLFDEHGPDNVSMEAIAAEAGVGKGTLFRRFEDRSMLAQTLLSTREARFQEEVLRGSPPLGPGAPPVERLVAFGRGVLRLLDKHVALMYAAQHNPMRRRREPYVSYRQHVRLLIEEADPSADADLLADELMAWISADLFSYLRKAREVSLERLEASWELLVRRLLGPSGGA